MECTVCAEESEYFGLPECEHKDVCSLCWFRMTTLLKTNQCPVCRHECKTIFIVNDIYLTFEELNVVGWGDQIEGFLKDIHSGMFFESKAELNRLAALKKVSCLICKSEMRNLNDYKNHAKNVHDKVLCDQCAQSSKLFPSEQSLFEAAELVSHKNSLHKKCNVCNNYFYDASNLVAHIKQSHNFCEFCPFEQRVAYIDYSSLEKHYIDKHFYCPQFECRRLKCFVFKKYEDLQDHFYREHPGQPVPKPALGFKVSNEEDKCVFEDTNMKRNQRPGDANLMEFPALGNPSQGKSKGLDYSRAIKKPMNAWVQPAFSPPSGPVFAPAYAPPRSQVQVKEERKISKQEERPREQKPRQQREFYDNFTANKSPPKLSVIDANISRLNSGNITREEFLDNIRNSINGLDQELIKKLRTEINSNSDREWVVHQLELKKSNSHRINKPVASDQWEEVKAPVQVFDKIVNENTKKNRFENQDLRAMDTLLENICLLNTGLIDENDFTESMKGFLKEDQIQPAIEIISENISQAHDLNSICNKLRSLFQKKDNRGNSMRNNPRGGRNHGFQNPVNKNNVHVSGVQDFPPINHAEKMKLQEILIENLELYGSKLISLTELLKAFADVIEPGMREFAYEVINKNSDQGRDIIEKLREMLAQANSRDMRAMPYDRRPRQGNRGRNQRPRGR